MLKLWKSLPAAPIIITFSVNRSPYCRSCFTLYRFNHILGIGYYCFLPAFFEEIYCRFDLRSHASGRELALFQELFCLFEVQFLQQLLVVFLEVQVSRIYVRDYQQDVCIYAGCKAGACKILVADGVNAFQPVLFIYRDATPACSNDRHAVLYQISYNLSLDYALGPRRRYDAAKSSPWILRDSNSFLLQRFSFARGIEGAYGLGRFPEHRILAVHDDLSKYSNHRFVHPLASQLVLQALLDHEAHLALRLSDAREQGHRI